MTKILRGKEVSSKISNYILEENKELKEKGIVAKLAIIRMGNNPDDITYEKTIVRNCKKLGIDTVSILREKNISTEDLINTIESLNKDGNISGILILSLLTTRDDQEIIRRHIDPDKDIDAIHPLNLEKLFRGDVSGFAPCAAKAAISILENNNVDFKGKNVVIINRSMAIGRPLAMMALEKDSTITICHSKTKDLKSIVRRGDIIFTGIGKARYFTKDYFKNDAIVVDLGIDFDEDGKLSGDVDFEDVKGNVSMLTPVPGGIGGITTSILLKHTVEASSRKINK